MSSKAELMKELFLKKLGEEGTEKKGCIFLLWLFFCFFMNRT